MPGQDRYILQEWQILSAIRVEPWGINTPHPVWDGGAFLFCGTEIPKSVNQTVT